MHVHSKLMCCLTALNRKVAYTALLGLTLATGIGVSHSFYERTKIAWKSYSQVTKPFYSGSPFVDARRMPVRSFLPENESLYLYVSRDEESDPDIRALHIGLLWECLPQKVIQVTTNLSPKVNYLATSVYNGGCPVTDKGPYVSLDTEVDGPVWGRVRALNEKRPAIRIAPSPVREFAGIIIPILLMFGCLIVRGWAGLASGLLLFSIGMSFPPLLGFSPSPYFVALITASILGCFLVLKRRKQKLLLFSGDFYHLRFAPILATLILFGILGFLTLSHTFSTPNGLGVVGGKAKLLFLSKGIPLDFFSASAWEVLQPAYPPGLCLFTLGCYGAAGGCGEWLTQLLTCIFSGLCCLCLCRRFSVTLPGILLIVWIFSTFLSIDALLMATYFYPEPLMLLFLLIGTETVLCTRNINLGWLLIGACGWFKIEGILYLPILWLAVRMISGNKRGSLIGLLIGLFLPLIWLVYSRYLGASVYDYAPLTEPDILQMEKALYSFVHLAFFEPWRYGFAYPLACCVVFVPSLRTNPLLIVTAAMIPLLLTFIWIFGISRVPDFEWHLRSLARLLWPPAILFLSVFSRRLLHLLRTKQQAF